MGTREVIRVPLQESFDLIDEQLRRITDEEWVARVLPDTSTIGFIPWHCARTLDWGFHRVAAGRPEIAEAERWRTAVAFDDGLFGSGIAMATADEIPRKVSRQTVLEYLGEVRRSAMSWLDSAAAADLDREVDLRSARYSRPEYRSGETWKEMEDLVGIPVWQFLLRPNVHHIRSHMGELDLLLAHGRRTSRARDAR